MRRAAASARSIIELARLRPGESDQLLDVGRCYGGMCDEYVGGRSEQRDRREIPGRIVAEGTAQSGADAQGPRSTHDDRVAVSRRLRCDFGADSASGAGAVIDDDLLAQALAQRLGDEAARHVDRPAGGIGHDEADGPAGIICIRRDGVGCCRG